MGILALAADERVADVKITEDELSVRLWDGRTISVPLNWYPRLLNATEEQRKNWRIIGGGYGIHWEDIDEDLSTEGLLRGAPAPRRSLTETKLFSPHPKHRAASESKRVASPDRSPNLENEKGITDYLAEALEASKELRAIMEGIGQAAKELSARIQQHSTSTQLASDHAQSVAETAWRTILLSLPDMDNFSDQIKAILPRFEKVVRLLEENFSAIVSLAKPESSDDIRKIAILQKTLSAILENLIQPKGTAIYLRDRTSSLIAKQPPKAVIESSEDQEKALNGVISNIEEIESFALRIMYQIREKFGLATDLSTLEE